MRLRKKIFLLILLFMLITTFISSFNVVSASVSEGTLKLNIKMKRSSGYGYKFSAENGSGHSVWKIYDTESDRNETIYCLKGGAGFGSTDMSSTQPKSETYTQHFDMRNPEEMAKLSRLYSSISSEDNILLDTDGQNYRAVMWILDNCFILPEKNSSGTSGADITTGNLRRDNLLASALKYAESVSNAEVNATKFSYLTDDDIDVVQQLAIWHFTNSDESDSYHVKDDFVLSLNAIKDDVNQAYKPLSETFFTHGRERLEACKALFEYLVETPKELDYDYKNVNTNTNPIKFSSTNVTMNESENGEDRYILGPYKLEREASEDNKNYNLEAKVVTGDNDGAEVSDFKLLNVDKSEVQKVTEKSEGTELDELVGKEFYISIPKTENLSKITLKISGKYTTTKVIYWSVNNPGDTDQPVVKIEPEEHKFEIEKDFTLAQGNYEIELEKVDAYNTTEKLQGAQFTVTVNGVGFQPENSYTTDDQGKINIKNIPISKTGTQIVTITETKAPEGYSNQGVTITLTVNTDIKNGTYVVKSIASSGTKKKGTNDSTKVEDYTAELDKNKIVIQMKNYQLDLALRKFITSIDGNDVKNKDGKFAREPSISEEEKTKLANNTVTTAKKEHTKEPLVVRTGDKVIYIIRVYNEGKIAGYAKKVTDYLPEGLKFLPESEVNKAYGWKSTSEDGRTIETEKLAEDLIKAFDGENLDYKDLKIECEVVAEAGKTDKTLKNIAEITKHSDENNDETVDDRDSTPNNVEKDKYEDKSQEDDDDFENLLVEKIKDGRYSLEIEKVNGQNLEEKLEGAEFEIILPDGTRKTYTSNEQGKITIDELLINEVGEQIITIKETKAPSGYSKSMDTIIVKVVTALEDAKYTAKAFSIKEVAQDDSEATSLVEDLTEIKAGKTELKANVVDGKIYIQMNNYKLDLALRKFITKVNDTDITNRVPVFTKLSETEFKYVHPKDPVEVANGNIVTYTLRIFNEGKIAGYASKIKDDLPDGLTFLPDHETNVEYRWKMYTKDGVETENVEEAEYIETDYLAKENEQEENANLLKAFDQETMTMPDYRDVKIAFLVSEPNTSDRIIINTAEITDDRDEHNEPVEDIDSTPDNDEPDEDDIDEEKVKVKYFDLSLKKWVSEAIVTCDGKTTVTKTGHTGDENPEPPVKVEIRQNKFNKTTVKFKFVIKVTNEGEIAGYAKELIDYIPQGLKFDPKDNPLWREEDGKVLTDQLKDTLLQPGESAEVEIILTWINGKDNLGEKVNWAEIYDDDNEPHSPDIDSTPGNNKPGEDDIDRAPVILSTSTGSVPMYVGLIIIVTSVLAGGVVLIKKFVI